MRDAAWCHQHPSWKCSSSTSSLDACGWWWQLMDKPQALRWRDWLNVVWTTGRCLRLRPVVSTTLSRLLVLAGCGPSPRSGTGTNLIASVSRWRAVGTCPANALCWLNVVWLSMVAAQHWTSTGWVVRVAVSLRWDEVWTASQHIYTSMDCSLTTRLSEPLCVGTVIDWLIDD